jgi:hypothetical protein
LPAQECPSCLYPHQGDLRYVNLGNASDQSCAGGALVRGIMAMKAARSAGKLDTSRPDHNAVNPPAYHARRGTFIDQAP